MHVKVRTVPHKLMKKQATKDWAQTARIEMWKPCFLGGQPCGSNMGCPSGLNINWSLKEILVPCEQPMILYQFLTLLHEGVI